MIVCEKFFIIFFAIKKFYFVIKLENQIYWCGLISEYLSDSQFKKILSSFMHFLNLIIFLTFISTSNKISLNSSSFLIKKSAFKIKIETCVNEIA